MTDSSHQLRFSFYQGKERRADFKAGEICSDTSSPRLRTLDEKPGWLSDAAPVLWDPRDPNSSRHKLLRLLRIPRRAGRDIDYRRRIHKSAAFGGLRVAESQGTVGKSALSFQLNGRKALPAAPNSTENTPENLQSTG